MCARTTSEFIAAAAALTLLAVVFFPSAAAANRWHESFVFDACDQHTLVKVEYNGTTKTEPFDRQRHGVKAGTPVSLTIRYPKLFTSYQVLVEALEVPDAFPHIRGTAQLPAINFGERNLPATKGAQDIETIAIERVTVESVLRAFLTRESATQLILEILTDRQKIVDGARTVATDLRELHEAIDPVMGGESGGPPYDRVPSLTVGFKYLRREVGNEARRADFCRLQEAEKRKRVADADRRRKIREWIDSTDELVVNHRRIGERWQDVGADGLFDRVIRDAEDLDTLMNTFLDNLRAHDAALELLDGLVDQNGRLPHTALRDRWVLDFAGGLRAEYSELRGSEELRAIAERFEGELGLPDDYADRDSANEDSSSHVAWLREFAHELREVVGQSTVTVGGTVGEVRGHRRGAAAVTILHDAREHLQREIDLVSTLGAEDTDGLRSAVHGAVARVMDARIAINQELSRLNEEAAKLFSDVNTILSRSRGSEIELPLGVYNTNAVVAYRVFEQAAHQRYALVSAATPETFRVTPEGGVRGDEAGATIADAAGEGFRFVGGSIFEVHRTYRLAAFGAFTWTPTKTREYKVRENGVPVKVGTSRGQLSYVLGAKVHFPGERDLFPGSRNLRQFGLVVGVPVNHLPGILFGGSWGPYGGVELLGGWHWAKYGRLDKDIKLGETQLQSDSDGDFQLPVHERHRLEPFLGVSLDSNIFTSLFGVVARIGGAF